MRRRQLIELEDLPWCPRTVRDGGTDWLAFMANATGFYSAVAPILRSTMDAARTDDILDLCSGGGGPWLTLERELAKTGRVHVTLSDLYPNIAAMTDVCTRSGHRLTFHPAPVDATNVPEELEGVRTLFNAFHHFPPDAARAILADAVAKRRPLAVFEAITSRALGLVAMPIQLPLILLLTPFVRPFRLSRLVFTYLLPLIPILVLVDGTVSFLRVYQPDELRELVAGVPNHESFAWSIGSTSVAGLPIGLTHLVGVPSTT